MRDVHPPLISKEEWREAKKNRVSMPDREAVILEEITGEGILLTTSDTIQGGH